MVWCVEGAFDARQGSWCWFGAWKVAFYARETGMVRGKGGVTHGKGCGQRMAWAIGKKNDSGGNGRLIEDYMMRRISKAMGKLP